MSKRLIYAEDVIDAVHNLYAIFGSEGEWVDRKDVFEAIEQLPSAQPQACDDAISREDAKWVVFCNRDHVEDQTNAIDSLPCVQPKRIEGRWERKESDLSWWYECTSCGESPLYDPYENEVRTPFCPWCGAWMLDEPYEGEKE